jgi:polyisoprenoid-binding protein YceI
VTHPHSVTQLPTRPPARWWALAGLIAICGASCAAADEPATFRVDPELTAVEFAVTHLGIARQHGRFERTWGSIVLDPAQASGRIDFVIDTTSVNTGWNLRDEFLRGTNMLDVLRYPAIRFHSTSLRFEGERLVAVDGDVELHGVTQPVRLDVKRMACAIDPADGREGCGAEVATRISRRAFGMSFAYPLVGDDIELDFAITAFRVPDAGEAESP